MQSSQFQNVGLLQPFFVPKPHNRWRPILDLSKPNLSETIRTTLPTRGLGYLNRFQGRLPPYTNIGTVQEISDISCPGSEIPVQRQERRVGHVHRLRDACFHIPIQNHSKNISEFSYTDQTYQIKHLVCPQLSWASV